MVPVWKKLSTNSQPTLGLFSATGSILGTVIGNHYIESLERITVNGKRTMINLLLDLLMATGFVIAMRPFWTGLALHE